MVSLGNENIESLVIDIRGLHTTMENLISQFRQVTSSFTKEEHQVLNKRSRTFWKYIMFQDSLVRLRLFIEQNFTYIEPMWILAVARYLFELTIWLNLVQKDNRYALVYYRELIKNQLDYYNDLRDHLTREIEFLRNMGKREKAVIEELIKKAKGLVDDEVAKQAISQIFHNVTEEIDQETKRRFTMYGQQALINGYDFQSHLVEKKVLPQVFKTIADLEQEARDFDRDAPKEIKYLIPKRWKWRDRAGLVDMQDEYDFIYSYTSRLLHATPASLTTNQKNLEPDEVKLFLDYIHVRLVDIIHIARNELAIIDK